ncbi:unnamed protein product [Effrenium voratum]|uniref:Uncharacterized protein n=1 Tax=Effrenium voratum TaxID=2562239 RepID=A0AA36HNU6_9DINO|nr:unnamed protein product [Effrenium voratum]
MKISELVQNIQENDGFADKFESMRRSGTQFSIMYPARRYRHEKPDLKVLLERKEEMYVDVAEVLTWQSLKRFCDLNFASKKFKNDQQRKAFLLKQNIRLQKDERGVEGVAVAKDGASDEKEIKIGKRL